MILDIQQSQIDYRPNCVVHVVEPAYLGFTVLPDRVWVLESGRYYTIIIDLYDRDSNRIQISEVRYYNRPIISQFNLIFLKSNFSICSVGYSHQFCVPKRLLFSKLLYFKWILSSSTSY